MGYFINSTMGYYEGDPIDPADTIVSQRPGLTYVWQDGAWAVSQPAVHAALAIQAQAALDKSDTTVVRCSSAGVAVPAAWQTYRTALRAIVSGADMTSAALPATPPYPAGT